MPVFDQGYQHWKGPLSGHAWRWLAITRHGIRVQLRGWRVRTLVLMAWIPALALVIALALWGLFEQGSEDVGSFLKPLLPFIGDPHDFRAAIWTLAYATFFKVELYFIMLLVMLVGQDLISRDLRMNALPLYFSRPLGRFDYFLGKLGVIAALVAAVAVAPALAAYLLGICFSLDLGVVGDTWRLLPASLVYGLLAVFSTGPLMLAFSSMSRRTLYVGIAWIALWLIGSAVSAGLEGIREESIRGDVYRNTTALKPTGTTPPWVRADRMVQRAEAESAPTDWRPLCSYTANLQRLGDALLGTDAAWVRIGKAVEAPKAMLGPLLGSPMDNFYEGDGGDPRRLADRNVLQYPWTWSAGILAALLAISLWILSLRIKSLDRLR